jgi:hypothetical protein
MAKSDNTPAVTKPNLPALAGMYEEDAGGGFESADKDSYAIPFLSILQALSPQLNKQDGAYIKGAEQGMILNTATQEVFDGDKGIIVVPSAFKRSFTHWQARDAGGGFLGEHKVDDPILEQAQRNDRGALALQDGTYFNDSRAHYVLLLDDVGGFQPALISMTSTQIKKSRQWMTRMQNLKMRRADGSVFTPPMYSHAYKLTTVPESNNQGSWYGWKIELVGPVEDSFIYQSAKQFRDSIIAGEVKEQLPVSEDHAAGEF